MALKQWVKDANEQAIDMADAVAKTYPWKLGKVLTTAAVAWLAGYWLGTGEQPVPAWIVLFFAVVCIIGDSLTFHYREKNMYWRGVRNGWETAPHVIHHPAPPTNKEN